MSTRSIEEISDTMSEKINKIIATRGRPDLPSGFKTYDYSFFGIIKGTVVVIAGASGIGKTAFLVQLVKNVCLGDDHKKQVPTLVFSNDINGDDFAFKLLGNVANMDFYKFKDGFIDKEGHERLGWAGKKIKESPLFINDSFPLSIEELRKNAEDLVNANNIKLIVVDNINQIVSNNSKCSRHNQLHQISMELKEIAKRFNVAIFIGCQLQVGWEKDSKSPSVADILDSESIANNADLVCALINSKRPDLITDERVRPIGYRDLKVIKNNNGHSSSAFSVTFKLNKRTCSFKEESE